MPISDYIGTLNMASEPDYLDPIHKIVYKALSSKDEMDAEIVAVRREKW